MKDPFGNANYPNHLLLKSRGFLSNDDADLLPQIERGNILGAGLSHLHFLLLMLPQPSLRKVPRQGSVLSTRVLLAIDALQVTNRLELDRDSLVQLNIRIWDGWLLLVMLL